MKRLIEGQSRDQVTLFLESLDDWINLNNPVQVDGPDVVADRGYFSSE